MWKNSPLAILSKRGLLARAYWEGLLATTEQPPSALLLWSALPERQGKAPSETCLKWISNTSVLGCYKIAHSESYCPKFMSCAEPITLNLSWPYDLLKLKEWDRRDTVQTPKLSLHKTLLTSTFTLWELETPCCEEPERPCGESSTANPASQAPGHPLAKCSCSNEHRHSQQRTS